MKNKFLRLIACLLALAMMISNAVTLVADENGEVTSPVTETEETPVDTVPAEGEEVPAEGEEVPAEGEEAPAEGEEAPAEGEEAPAEGEEAPAEGEEAPAEEEEEEEEAPLVALTDEEALARCELVAENDNLILYLDREFERIGLYVKESGYIHWSNCVNALLDNATDKDSLRQNRLSNLAIKYGNVTDLITSSYLYSYRVSTSKEKTEFELVDGGVKVTYNYNTAKAEVPVYFVLEDDYLEVYVKTGEIKETAGYNTNAETDEESKQDVIVLTDIAIAPYMSAATAEDTGYMFVPDGSGAIINLNNGKGNYANYSQNLYGRDITKVRENAPDEMEQSYLPVMAMVKENNGLVMIATDGDTHATVNAAVNGSKSDQSSYNYCYFSFSIRSTDDYYMTGDSSSIIVFERGDGSIQVDKVAVRYYPITSDSETVQLGEIADVYRNYLVEEEGLTKKTEAGSAPLYVEYYGGTLKSKSILGIPINIKTAYTTFKEAIEITDELIGLGVNDMVVNYNDWTDDSMSSKVDTAKSVASVLGGKAGLKNFFEYLAEKNIKGYASITGFTFQSNGNGFMTLFNTAYRVSKSYSRQYYYNIAFGTPYAGIAPALLSPRSIDKLSNKVTKNFSKYGLTGAGLGEISETLWSDFSTKNRTNRCMTAEYVIDYYKSVKEATGSIIANSPNAYLLPYVDNINNLTLQSSQFKVVDYDVPFYQMVIHGYIPYATEPINAAADSTELFLKAIASGSNIHFDFIHEEAIKLVNTSYVKLFYANYEGWTEYAAQTYKLANEILSKVSDATMVNYAVDGDVITTTYDNGVVTTVNLETGVITADGKTYVFSDYVEEGGIN